MIKSGAFYQLSQTEKARWVQKLKNRYKALKRKVPAFALRKVLKGTALFLGLTLGGPAYAQLPEFGPTVRNPFNFENTTSTPVIPSFVDIDGDGDQDLFTTSYGTTKFFENIGTSEIPFFAATQVPIGVQTNNVTERLEFVDIDDDGDFDLFYGFDFSENTGTATNAVFGSIQTNPLGFDIQSTDDLRFSDLDNDGDLDAIATSNSDIFYYVENIGTSSNANFGDAELILDLGPNGIMDFDLGDLDDDGDIDIVESSLAYYYAGGSPDGINFIENTGTADAAVFQGLTSVPFSSQLDFTRHPPELVDIDNDGDLDIFFGDYIYGGGGGVLPALNFIENKFVDGNLPATSEDFDFTINENTFYNFSPIDFAFNDVDGDALAGIKITTLPTDGQLLLNGTAISLDEEIAVNDISELKFVPIQNTSGTPYTSFEFKVFDGTTYSFFAYDVSIAVEPSDCDLAVDLSVSNMLSNPDASDGCIEATVSNGQPPFTYNWSNNGDNENEICDLLAGYYLLTVTDNLGCEAFGQQALGITVNVCTGNFNFTTQQQIDNFAIDYPGCISIEGNVLIGNADYWQPTEAITNLDGLSQITNITGNLRIHNITNLTDLNGLENIVEIGGSFHVRQNPALEHSDHIQSLTTIGAELRLEGNGFTILSGFDQLTAVGDILRIHSNDGTINGFNSLETVPYDLSIQFNDNVAPNAFNSLISVGSFLEISSGISSFENAFTSLNSVGEGFEIVSNSTLTTLVGLENLTYVGGALFIGYNDVLADLNGLQNLEHVGGQFNISGNGILESLDPLANINEINGQFFIDDNPLLSFCSIQAICTHLSNNGEAYLNGNSTGCASANQILLNCSNSPKINYNVFYDINQNGIRDDDEPSYTNVEFNVSPNNQTFYIPSGNGIGSWYVPTGDYNLSFDSDNNPGLTLTTSTSSFDISIDDMNPEGMVTFGIYPDEQLTDMASFIVSPLTRCSEAITFEVSTKNFGTTIVDGTLWLQIDENIIATDFIDPPDIADDPNVYGWYFESLSPGNIVTKQISLTIPGVDEFTMGDALHFESYSDFEDVNGGQTSTTYAYDPIVLCSYDPNDKLVSPDRNGNYTLFEEDLFYTIRFQNTGNAEAYDVVIRDTLDPNLDWSTFNILSTSHPEVLTTSLSNEGYLTFEFRDIFLPDSTTNFEESQGFVSYVISPIDGLDENTPIENTAGIYFDFNPPVITNTTENIMVSELPTDPTMNVAPSSQNISITTNEDDPYLFTVDDFPFTDLNGDELVDLKITALPESGVLEVNGSPIPPGFELGLSSIDDLQFIPLPHENGLPYTTFGFSVSDGELFSENYDVSIGVFPVNDAPISQSFSITIEEDVAYTFANTDFVFNDIDGDDFIHIQLFDLPAAGALVWNGNPVGSGQGIPFANISELQFIPEMDELGTPYASFEFRVFDGETPSDFYTVVIDVIPGNDAPVSADFVISTNEDVAYTFGNADFVFNDIDGDELAMVKFISLPDLGDLTLNGLTVTVDQEIVAVDIPQLQFLPLENESGIPYTSFEFRVSDGLEFSATHIASIEVQAVNDAPTSENFEVTTAEDMIYDFEAIDFPFSDIDADELQVIKILSLPTEGVLTLNTNEVTTDQNINIVDISALQFTPDVDEFGEPYASFDFAVSDGMDFSEMNTVTINVTSVTNVLDQFQAVEITLYPNPTEGILNVSINWKTIPQDFTIEVIDIYGRQVDMQEVTSASLNYNNALDFSHLASGMYFLRVDAGAGMVVKKFIIE